MSGDDMSDDMSEVVEVKVAGDVCMGIGQCEMLEPDVFEMDDDGIAQVVQGAVVPRKRALELIDRCPSGAITISADPRPSA